MMMGIRFRNVSARLASPALLSPALLVAGASLVGCIPNPDISGLPPFDASTEDAAPIVIPDASIDNTIPPVEAGPPTDGGGDVAQDTSVPPGTISGVVFDYTQANGKGVLAGATVTVSVLSSSAVIPTVTTDANGQFTVPNVPSGQVQVSVSKATDLTAGIAYSTGIVVTNVPSGGTVNVSPIVHEGCFQTYVLPGALNADASANQPVTLQNAQCGGGPGSTTRTGAYAAFQFIPTGNSFADCGSSGVCTSTSPLYSKVIRVEMIPLAYPVNGSNQDLSWAVGLPGLVTPPALLGAAEYRVVKHDPGQSDDGQLLGLSSFATNPSGSNFAPVAVAVPVYTTPGSTPAAYSYDALTAQAWTAETATTPFGPEGLGADAGVPVQYELIEVSHLAPTTWWGLSNGSGTTTCITGSVTGVSGSVLVRANGDTYLGEATATTSLDGGTFCVDGVQSTSSVTLYAAAASGAIPISGSTGAATTGNGTCKTPSGCFALTSAIALSPNLTCASGDLVAGDASVPLTVDVMESFAGLGYAASAGISPNAYLGQAATSSGNFCALGFANGTVTLTNPTACGTSSPVSIPLGSSNPTCGTSCLDAGTLSFNCP
jgi:hypothetical protein